MKIVATTGHLVIFKKVIFCILNRYPYAGMVPSTLARLHAGIAHLFSLVQGFDIQVSILSILVLCKKKMSLSS